MRCIRKIWHKCVIITLIIFFIFPDKTPGIIGCREDLFHEKSDDVRFIFYPIGLALSTIFLAATLACGFLLPASHHVLHWRCQTNYVFCLLIGFAVLCVVQLQSRMNPTLCIILGEFNDFIYGFLSERIVIFPFTISRTNYFELDSSFGNKKSRSSIVFQQIFLNFASRESQRKILRKSQI